MKSLFGMHWGWAVAILVIVTAVVSVGGTFLALYLMDGGGAISLKADRTPAKAAAEVMSPVPPLPTWAFHPIFRRDEPPVVKEAKKYLGIPYLFGGELARDGSVDCSSFTQLVYAPFGISLPRTTYGQVAVGEEISADDLLPGDLIFFQNTTSLQSGVTHVGIYIGYDEFIHASGSIGKVAITRINDPFYRGHWHSVRRVLEQPGN